MAADTAKVAAENVNKAPFSGPVLDHLKRIYDQLSHAEPRPVLDVDAHDAKAEGKKSADPLASLDDFLAYMNSPSAKADRDPGTPDLSAPISNYYVSSSHNTYLTGNQLSSDASAEAYTEVLRRGCRCLEIDVWDGVPPSDDEDDKDDDASSTTSSSSSSSSSSDDSKKSPSRIKTLSKNFGHLVRRSTSKKKSKNGADVKATAKEITTPSVEPRVLHGFTMTREVSFRDVCYAIRDSAFVASDLPVIVSLEVHCSLEQQQIMVDIMQEAWKDYLLDIEKCADDTLPRLGDLKRKILIKAKWAPPPSEEEQSPTKELQSKLEEMNVAAEEAKNESQSKNEPEKPSKILHALSRLAVYMKGFSFKDFSQEEASIPTHVFSLSEDAIESSHESDREALLEHNRHFLMRVYPSGMRVTSSNYDPLFAWQQGAQMVALNWQQSDKGMMLNDGMFANGPGWVLKPEFYRSGGKNSRKGVVSSLDLAIEVFAGHQIPLPLDSSSSLNADDFRPYVTCRLHLCHVDPDTGAAADYRKASKSKARTKSRKGVDPDFEGEKLEFATANNVLEELSFLRLKIKNDEFGRDPSTAWACIRLDRLKEGYRLLHLKDTRGRPSSGVLLVKVTKRVS